MQQIAQILEVLHDKRLVVASRVNARLQLLRGESAAERGGDGVAGGAHHEEHHGDENENGWDDKQEPGQDETEESA